MSTRQEIAERGEEKVCDCGHPAEMRWQWAPGHLAGYKCTCCAIKIWRETIANCTKAVAEAKPCERAGEQA